MKFSRLTIVAFRPRRSRATYVPANPPPRITTSRSSTGTGGASSFARFDCVSERRSPPGVVVFVLDVAERVQRRKAAAVRELRCGVENESPGLGIAHLEALKED